GARSHGAGGAVRSSLGGERGFGFAGLDRVVDRVAAPLEPAAVVDGDPAPAHQVGIEPGLACPPARSAIEGDVLVGSDAGLLPVGGDLRVVAHRVVEVAVVLHVVGVGAAVAPHVAGDASCRADVVVSAVLTDVLVPGADADEGGAFGVGEDLLGLDDVDDGFGPLGDASAERGDRLGLAADRFERVTGLSPGVVAAVEQADVVDAAVVQDQRGASGGNLAGATAR